MNSSREGGPRPPSNSPQPPIMSPLTPTTAAQSPAQETFAAGEDHESNSAAQPNFQSDPKLLPAAQLAVETAQPTAEREERANTPTQPESQQLPSQMSLAEQQMFATPTTLEQSAAFGNPSMDMYSHSSLGQMAFALMNMASLQRLPPMPTAISPAQMTLPRTSRTPGDSLPGNLNGNGTGAKPVPLESFARIEFADSEFQMTTYAVIIGRDQRALQQARRDAKRKEIWDRRVAENLRMGLPPPSPPSKHPPRFSRSWYSEEGGMLGPESDGGEEGRPAKRRKTSVNGSGSGNSQQYPAEQAPAQAEEEAAQDVIANRQYVSHTPGAAAVDVASLRPSPYDVPFIGIHSPGEDAAEIAKNTKGISREHMKIQFNPKTSVFEAIAMHHNGFFCQEVFHKEGSVVLHSGDRIQIKDISFDFHINGVEHGKTGAEDYADEDVKRRYSEGGKEMSFEFESSHAADVQSTSEDEPMAGAEVPEESASELSDVPDDEMDLDENDDSAVMETIEKDAEGEEATEEIKPEPELESTPQLPMLPPKKRGPGRPPKNGIMSKREERILKKQQQEAAKKTLPQLPPGEPPIKRKVGRPRKHPLPENAGDQPERRKYKPRKPKGEEGAEGEEGEKAIKEKRREKPKTPPLELDRNNYTEDQLQKPNKNYGVLIDEVLTAAPDGLTLKQIYKRIQMKYPFYYFSVDTKGWESSVRHNLIGNAAFKKNDETHLWSRVPGIDIDSGKKRKAPSPDHALAAGYMGHHYAPHMQHAMYNGGHMAQGYQAGQEHRGYQQQYAQNPAAQQPQYAPHQSGVGLAGTVGAPAVQQQQHPHPHPGYQIPGQGQTAGPSQVPAYNQPAQGPQPPSANVQPSTYASPYPARPQNTTATMPPGTTPHSLAQQAAQPHTASQPTNGVYPGHNPAAHFAPGVVPGRAPSQPAQPAAPVNTGPPKPAVAPELLKWVTQFRDTVTQQLASRTPAPLAIALSVINRGLGLVSHSLATTIVILPAGKERDEEIKKVEQLEKIVFSVFQQGLTGKTAGKDKPMELDPTLKTTLLAQVTRWVGILGTKLGQARSEALVLSAIDRTLGFVDHSVMQGDENAKAEYERAELVLVKHLAGEIAKGWQMNPAPAATPAPASASPAPAPTPAAPASTPRPASAVPAVAAPKASPAPASLPAHSPSAPLPRPSPAASYAHMPKAHSPSTPAPVAAMKASPAPVPVAQQAPAYSAGPAAHTANIEKAHPPSDPAPVAPMKASPAPTPVTPADSAYSSGPAAQTASAHSPRAPTSVLKTSPATAPVAPMSTPSPGPALGTMSMQPATAMASKPSPSPGPALGGATAQLAAAMAPKSSPGPSTTPAPAPAHSPAPGTEPGPAPTPAAGQR